MLIPYVNAPEAIFYFKARFNIESGTVVENRLAQMGLPITVLKLKNYILQKEHKNTRTWGDGTKRSKTEPRIGTMG